MNIKPVYTLCLFLLILTAHGVYAQQNMALVGKVTEEDGQTPVPGSSISVDKKGIGTSANKNGAFLLLVAAGNLKDTLRVSCLGYKTVFIAISDFKVGQERSIILKASNVSLKEVNIAYYDAAKIIQTAIARIPKNYINHPHVTRGFYRMYTANGNEPLELSEAVFDIYNFGYADKHADLFRLIKARDKKNQRDFALFSIGLQPNTIFNYDVVNHLAGSGFLNEAGITKHTFKVNGIVDVRGYQAYEIAFKANDDASDESFRGKLYIDTKTYAFIYFDFGLSPTALLNGGAGIFAGDVLRSTANVKLNIKTDRCRVGYQKVGEKWVIADVTGDDVVNINAQDSTANFTASVRFNYQVTWVDTTQTASFTKKLGRHENINDHDSSSGEEYWKDYNILLSDYKTEDVFKRIQAINDEIKKKK